MDFSTLPMRPVVATFRAATGLAQSAVEMAGQIPAVQRAVNAGMERLPGIAHDLVQASGLKTPNTDLFTLSQGVLSEAQRVGVVEKADKIASLVEQGTHFEYAPKLAEEALEQNGNRYFSRSDFATLRTCIVSAIPIPKDAAIAMGDFLDRKITTLAPASRTSDEVAKGLLGSLNKARKQLTLIVSDLMTPKSSQEMVKDIEDGLANKGIIANFSDNLHITRIFGNGLEDIHARGVKIPKEIKASDTFPDASVAFDDSFENTILVNKKYPWKQANVHDAYRIVGQNLDSGKTYKPSADDLIYINRVAGPEIGNDLTGRAFKGFVFDELVSRADAELTLGARTLGLYKSLGGVSIPR